MSPEQFDALAATKFGSRLPDGSPVISLMGDPAGAGGPNDDTDLFVSVVPRGANGLRWAAIKADTGIPTTPAAKGASLPVRAWRSLVSFLGSEGANATAKGDDPTTFEAALYPRKMMTAMWDGQDALHTAIRGILEDEATTDKLGAIGKALDGFKAYVLEAAKPVVAAKAEDLPVIAAAAVAIGDPSSGDPLAAKIGKVISKRNAGRIRGAGKAVASALAELQALLDETGNAEDPEEDDADKAAKAATEDPMKLATAIKIATLTCKAADPKASDAVIAERAAEVAAKMMADPAVKEDVGEPAADFARLWGESGMSQGAGGAPSLPDAVLAALMKLPAMKSFADRLTALEAAVNGTPATKAADGADVPADPGIRELAEKAIELSIANAKALGIPSAPTVQDPDAARKAAEAARKAADPDGDNDTFADSGLGFGKW